MTVYARSDLAAVSISAHHGGCGETHSRPAPGGNPVRIWGLTCHAGCEDVLRKDGLWSSTPTTIPETPDEENIRKDAERRGSVEQAQATADALNQLAKLGDLPAVLGKFMEFMTAGSLPAAHAPQADIVATPITVAPELPAPVPAPAPAAVEDVPDLDNMNINELRKFAEKVGAKTARSRDDQIAAIRAVIG